MKALFQILPEAADFEKCTLIGELSPEGFSYCIKNEGGDSFLGVGIFQYDKAMPKDGHSIALQILLTQHEVLSQDFKKVCIIYSLPESVLVPFSLHNKTQNEEVLNLLHGDLNSGGKILSDTINAYDLYNIYRLPLAVYDVMESTFPYRKEFHHYTSILLQNEPEADQLNVIFYNEKMVVAFFKDGKYQLIQTYHFRSAEDVSYILLNILKQFNAAHVPIVLSGLIEEKSSLHNEIYKYFEHISFDTVPVTEKYPSDISKYSQHYFSHLFSFERCE